MTEEKLKDIAGPYQGTASAAAAGAGISTTVTKEQLKDIAEKLTTEDIAVFLKSIKLQGYIELFEENEIDGKLLYDCKLPKELEDLGIQNAFHCRKIISKFEQHLKNIAKTE